jgi:DNA-binding NtrC family response regulator
MVPENKPNILIVDDEEMCLDMMAEALEDDRTMDISSAGTAWEARELVKENNYDLLITDFRLKEGDSIPLIKYFHTTCPNSSILVVTAYPEKETLKYLTECGVLSLLVKPFSVTQLRYTVYQALETRLSSSQKPDISSMSEENILGLVGCSPHIKELRKRIFQLGPGNFPVLIQGDSGTGKEIIAYGIHECSTRQNNPMVTVNCAAIPRQLEESEFFGHTRGAFTGAQTSKMGYIATANNSTLFLDEIAELSLDVQAKFLRVLDSGEYLRIGETQPRKVDIRIISATNRKLDEMVDNNTFRRDLYFRLKGVEITTIPLAEIKEDIPGLIDHFISKSINNANMKYITRDAMEVLKSYNWPGNVRELKHVVEYLCTLASNVARIDSSIVESVLNITPSNSFWVPPYHEAKRRFESKYFTEVLEQSKGNTAKAARIMGLQRPSLIRKLKDLNIDPTKFKKD